MTDALVKGDRVEIRGLGSFTVKRYTGIDPSILARAMGKIYPNDIILGHIIANPDGIEMATAVFTDFARFETEV